MIKKDNPSVKERKFIYDRIEKYIESRRKRIKNGEELEAGGVVDALSDKGYTINQIAQAIMVLGFASISTTTRNATCLISDLLAFPEYFKILREEQKKIIETAEKDETGSPLLTKQEIDQFEYLNSTIRETLRHRANHLEAWRYTEVDRVLPNGMKIPKGTIMALDLPNIHFNPEVYGSKEINSKTRDNSLPLELQYNPFQFVKPKVKATRVTQDFLNFGMGKHACPGRFFAVQEITSLVCTLLQKYRIETKDNEKMPFYTGDFKIPMPNVVFKPLV
ncbi:cytochrome P450 [Neoconidiobolus thromboides FSU 785]|nr:cytochrome P450 [Neoconidiobolus thromboides FSU 785]